LNATATLAPVVHPKETVKPDFPAIVLTYTDALKALANNGGRLALGHVAAQTTRVISNLRRDSQKLRDAGVIRCEAEDWIITDKGRRWLLGQDVAAGVVEVGQADAVQAVAEPPAGFVSLSAHDIAFDQDNARQTSGLSPLDIEEMAASIREHGLLTPPIVRDRGNYMIKWGLVAGERRLRGWRLAIERGWLPADTRYLCQIFDGDDTRATEAALVENLQRVDLDNLEAAEGLRRLSDQADPPATAAAIAKRLGKEERWVEQRLKVAREATAANKERYRAFLRRQAEPDFVPAADPDPFRWTDLRNSVQKPKHITALEKNPALAMLVVELAQASVDRNGVWDAPVATTAWPPGGVADQATELRLATDFPFSTDYLHDDLTGAIALQLTGLACDWLIAEDFGDNPEDLLSSVREAALGSIAAAALSPGRWGTDFLNFPTANTDAAQTDNPDPSPTLRPGLTGDAFSLQLRSLAAGGEDGSEDGARSSSDPDPSPAGASPPDSEQGAPAADEAAPEGPAPAADPPSPAAAGAGPDPLATLTPLARLALLELAHAVATRGATTRGGERGAPIFDFPADPTGAWPELFAAKLVNVRQPANGVGWLGVLSEAGQTAVHTLAPRGFDRLRLGEHYEAAGLPDPLNITGAPLYATPWLRPPPTSEAGSPDPSPACREKTIPPKGSDEGSTAVAQPATDPIIGGLRAAAADLWHAAREARAIFDDLFEREASTEQMDAAARSLQAAQFALAPYLTPEQKAGR
jgi:ParB/RepB/Spo0J family partition protein